MCLFSLCLQTLFHTVMFLGTIKHKNNSVIHYGKFPNNDYYLFFCPSLILIHIIIGFSYLLLNVSTYHFSLLYLQINIKIYFVHIMQISYGVRGRDVGLPSTFATNVQCLIVICDKVSQYLPVGSSFSLGILVSSANKYYIIGVNQPYP
jgi:hypothetical protein